MSISIAQHAITILPTLLLDLWPSLVLLASFAVFILYNGSVVLGDKSNHISTLHLPQLLYFFAFTIFFSWPTLLSLLSAPRTLISRLPRPATLAFFAILACLAIHFNTIIHPFLLADNRHYTFYTVRLLLFSHPLTRCLAIPVYLVCGFLTIAALGGTARPRRGSVVAISRGRAETPDAVHVSWVLVWLMSTALSLVTAPLIEPRYFIIPWLVWRLHVPEVLPGAAGRNTTTTTTPQIQPTGQGMLSPSVNHTYNPDAKSPSQQPSITSASASASSRSSLLPLLQTFLAQFAPHIEFLWYTVINMVTCYVFLYRSFTWKQEPGVEMRFMW
jgi:alpha-1,2-glucosyltransferase